MASYGGGLEETLGFGETELRLGLPGGGDHRKRGFGLEVDLKLNLAAKEMDLDLNQENSVAKYHNTLPFSADKPPAKAQIVGWPPVRATRRNQSTAQKRSSGSATEEPEKVYTAAFVKVSMDGAPYLRKVDLKMYRTYQQLFDALGRMFSSFTTGKCDTEGMLDFMNESKLMDLLSSSDYVPTYEDKDGDWMLVGDVPWEMFVGSCKRLRIMKATDAKGLAPRAIEKCKSRS